MRRLFTIILLAFAGPFATGCGKHEDAAVNEAALGFVKAMNKMDLETARKYATDSSKLMLDQMMADLKSMPDDRQKSFKEHMAERGKVTFTIKSTRIDGARASVVFSASDEPSRVDSVPLVKVGDKWLADMKGL